MFDLIASESRITCVVAHPDDESFGLGALVTELVDRGAEVSVLCLTRGEASTLGPGVGDLAGLRDQELGCAREVLGVSEAVVLDHPDGDLSNVPIERLVRDIEHHTADAHALLVFDVGGITGHPDHRVATRAAVMAGDHRDLDVFAWTIPASIAQHLAEEFGGAFAGRAVDELEPPIEVDRRRQIEAIRCHQSQSSDNPVVWRRLELQGNREWVIRLRPRVPSR